MKTLLLIIILAVCSNILFSQENYYSSKVAKGKYATYNVDSSTIGIYIHNAKNKGIHYMDEYPDHSFGTLVKLVNPDAFYTAFKQVFSQKEIDEFKADCLKTKKNDGEFYLNIIIAANNQGRIEELYIIIPDIPSIKKISPDRFDEFENILKATVKYKFLEERLKSFKYLPTYGFSIEGRKL